MRFCGNENDDDNKRGGSGILTPSTLHSLHKNRIVDDEDE
jgi:hypothetical protein